jgi:ribonuclease HI
VVATDASVGLGRGSAGIACVDERGCYHAEQFASRDVLYCELKAVLLALQRFPGPLRILTDSRSAIRLIDGSSPPKTRPVARVLAQVRRHLIGRQSTVEWVRGHADHPLNEAADHLALAARRRIEFAIPAESHQQICQRITTSLAAASSEGVPAVPPHDADKPGQ